MTLSATQCRDARVLLSWTKERLALESEIAPKTVHRFEANKRTPQIGTLQRIKQTLAGAGVEFIAENGGGAGVRLRKSGKEPAQPADGEAGIIKNNEM